MIKTLIAGALSLSALTSVAQNLADSTGSFALPVELQEVEVKANARIARADRNVILPSRAAVEASVNGRDLIGRLKIPRIIVNPLTGEIGLTGNGAVAITINGVLSSSAELAAIAPDDIVRVEHIDNPGPRYPDADVLINVITHRHSSGGSVMADLMGAFKKGGEADIDVLAVAFSHGKSQWTYSGQLVRAMRDNWARDYSETRVFPNRTVEISEKGSPSKMEIANIDNYLAYSIADGQNYLFNAKFGFLYNNVPHSEEADRTTVRTTSETAAPTQIYEHMGDRSYSPSLDLYGQVNFGNGASVAANIVGTYIKSKNTHVFRQTAQDQSVIEGMRSEIRGNKYSLIAEGAYTQRIGNHKIGGGVRHFQSHASNDYSGDAAGKVSINQAHTSVYAQYGVQLGAVNLMGSVGASRFCDSQSGISQSKWLFTPSVAASWSPLQSLSVRYKASLQGKTPALAELSAVEQWIEPGYLRSGNPKLKAFRVLNHEFSAGWQWRWIGVDLSVPMAHEFKPVMESVIWQDGAFVRTYFNQKSFTHIGAEASLTIRPWKDYIAVTLTPTIDYYRAKGKNYNCAYTIRNLRIDAELNWRSWQLSYNTITGYANYMYGTRLMRERNMSMITAGYKSDCYTVKVGVLDPFVKKYWMETRDMASLVSSVSKAYSNRPTYFVVQLSVNLNFGRTTSRRDIELDNSDSDSGLLRGTK